MEAGEIHGGYGNVTWNIGPHAGHEPYGPHHKIAFVDRNALLAGAQHQHNTSEMERHANNIGQQMDRGDVINVPHVKFVGGRPVIGPEHHGALHAAGQRGAEKVPVVVHRDHNMSLMLHAGGAEVPGAPRPGQDKRFKWRWNGKGWYTKPSFNQGQCPAGSSADSAADRCVGGGPPPGSAVGPEQKSAPPPAEFWGSESRPAGMAPPAGAPARVPAWGGDAPADGDAPAGQDAPDSSSPDLPEPIHLDRSPTPGAPVKLPPGYGIAFDVLDNRMDVALGARDPNTGVKRSVTLEPELSDTHQNRLTKEMIIAARDEMLEKFPPGSPTPFTPGEFLGAGAGGAVFKGPKDPDGLDTVYKFDAGPYEARLADAVIKAGLVGSNGLAILPRYISTHDTSQKFSPAGLPLHVIHREDLDDAKATLSGAEIDGLEGLGSFMAELQRKANPVKAPSGVNPDDIGIEPPMFLGFGGGSPAKWRQKAGRGWGREKLIKAYDRHISRIGRGIKRGTGQLAQQWDRIQGDLRQLLAHGIVPCDLHADNWGIRRHTGEIAMRDAGCISTVEH